MRLSIIKNQQDKNRRKRDVAVLSRPSRPLPGRRRELNGDPARN